MAWLQDNIFYGAMAIIFIYIIVVVLWLPQWPLTIGSGYAYGKAMDSVFVTMILGTTTTFIGAGTGALIS